MRPPLPKLLSHWPALVEATDDGQVGTRWLLSASLISQPATTILPSGWEREGRGPRSRRSLPARSATRGSACRPAPRVGVERTVGEHVGDGEDLTAAENAGPHALAGDVDRTVGSEHCAFRDRPVEVRDVVMDQPVGRDARVAGSVAVEMEHLDVAMSRVRRAGSRHHDDPTVRSEEDGDRVLPVGGVFVVEARIFDPVARQAANDPVVEVATAAGPATSRDDDLAVGLHGHGLDDAVFAPTWEDSGTEKAVASVDVAVGPRGRSEQRGEERAGEDDDRRRAGPPRRAPFTRGPPGGPAVTKPGALTLLDGHGSPRSSFSLGRTGSSAEPDSRARDVRLVLAAIARRDGRRCNSATAARCRSPSPVVLSCGRQRTILRRAAAGDEATRFVPPAREQ